MLYTVPSVGLEAEFLLKDKDNCLVIPPSHWDRDDFPLLGEIRANPGKNVAETVANFYLAKIQQEGRLDEGMSIHYEPFTAVPLCMYREVNRQFARHKKYQDIKNIYGIDIVDFSDQIVKNGKIQGMNVSCGLHIHFSLNATEVAHLNDYSYEAVVLPLHVGANKATIMDTNITLYRRTSDERERAKVEATVSKLNTPTINYLVGQLDMMFFERFAPPKAMRTKYRQPGFYERKPYGFEYRSLPCSQDVIVALPEIVGECYKLLNEVSR